MELLKSTIQPPYDEAALLEISHKQLHPHLVPHGYTKQLRHHLKAFPHDYLFQLIPHQGTGLGVVKCLEPGCSSLPIPLHPRTSKPDGGRSIGVGGLAEFQSHILEHELHEALRNHRIHHNKEKSLTPISLASTTAFNLSNLGTNIQTGKSSPHSSTVRSPLTSSKRTIESLSLDNPETKKLHASTPDSGGPSQFAKSSNLSSVHPDPSRMNISHPTRRRPPLIGPDSSDSDIHIIPDNMNQKKTRGSAKIDPLSTSPLDDDVVMVWLDGVGLVPLKRPSKSQSSIKRASASDRAHSSLHQSPLAHRSTSPAKPMIDVKPDSQPLPSKRVSPSHPLDILGRKALFNDQSHASASSFSMSQKPLESLLDLKKDFGGPSLDLLKNLPSVKPHSPFSSTYHLDPALQPTKYPSPLSRPVAKVKRELTPAYTTLPSSTPGSSKLPDVRNMLGNRKPLHATPPHFPILSPFGMGNISSLDQSSKLPSPSDLGLPWPSTVKPNPSNHNPEMRSDELQEFYKRAVEGIDFGHNATVAEARKNLGISEDEDARMEGLSVILMPHQLIGVSWMVQQEENRNSGGILADEMGLGKTIQLIATMIKNRSTDPKIKSNLILVPVALLHQWKEEIDDKSTFDLKVLIYHQSFSKPTDKKTLASYDVVITTLDTLSSDWDDDTKVTSSRRPRGLFKIEWYRVAIDEAQIIRNPHAKKSRAVCSLKSTFRWCLTGTPIFNGLMDIYPYLRFLHIRPYNDIAEFRYHITRFEKPNPNLATKRAQAVLATCMLRRQKDSKLDGKPLIVLPCKTVKDVLLDLSPDERDVYDMLEKRAQRKFNVFLRRGTVLKNFACILVLLLRLRQACGHPALTIEEGDPQDGAEVDLSFAPCYLDAYSEYKRALSTLGQDWINQTKLKFLKEMEELVKIEKNDPSRAAAPECPICSDPLDETSRITTCRHVFCQGCLETLFAPADVAVDEGPSSMPLQKPCPNCRNLFGQSDTYLKKAFLPSQDDDDSDGELPGFMCLGRRKARHGVVADSDEEDASTSSPKGKAKAKVTPYAELVPSTKLVWMLEEIIRVEKEYPSDKIIVISQWTAMLSLCADFLRERGYRYVQYQGDMNSQERNEAVIKFKRVPKISIMLMSLKSGGVGLNLTCANRVISLDLAWSPASERQAFDRTHRLGQVKKVMINRVMIQNSVEQRICDLQNKKQDLSDNALGEGSGKKLKRLTVSELANLFNLNVHGQTLN